MDFGDRLILVFMDVQLILFLSSCCEWQTEKKTGSDFFSFFKCYSLIVQLLVNVYSCSNQSFSWHQSSTRVTFAYYLLEVNDWIVHLKMWGLFLTPRIYYRNVLYTISNLKTSACIYAKDDMKESAWEIALLLRLWNDIYLYSPYTT